MKYYGYYQLHKSRKGAKWVKDMMSTRCVLVETSDTMQGGMNEYSTFAAKLQGSAGTR